MRAVPLLTVDESDALELHAWLRSGDVAPAVVRRARIVLLAAQGVGTTDISEQLGCSRRTVVTWRERYRARGLAGLRDAPRSGRPVTVDDVAVVERTLERPPARQGVVRWSTRTLATEMGISNGAVAGIWRAWGIRPRDGGGVRFATDPALAMGTGTLRGVLVTSSVRVLALVTGVRSGPEVTRRGPDLLARLRAVRPGEDVASAASLEAFLGAAAVGDRVQLVADGVGVAAPACVAPAGTWARMVQVAAMLSPAPANGTDAAGDLARNLDVHLQDRPGRPFTWLAPQLSP